MLNRPEEKKHPESYKKNTVKHLRFFKPKRILVKEKKQAIQANVELKIKINECKIM